MELHHFRCFTVLDGIGKGAGSILSVFNWVIPFWILDFGFWIGKVALMMNNRFLNRRVFCGAILLISGCSMIPQTRCNTAVATATQTWEVLYYISKTSGGLNTQRTQPFQSNSITNMNGKKPTDAVSGPDDNGIWWGAIPPRPTADEVDLKRDIQEHNDPPQLQRSVEYQLQCEDRTLSTDALTYREAARAIRAGQEVRVSYLWNRVMNIKSQNSHQLE